MDLPGLIQASILKGSVTGKKYFDFFLLLVTSTLCDIHSWWPYISYFVWMACSNTLNFIAMSAYPLWLQLWNTCWSWSTETKDVAKSKVEVGHFIQSHRGYHGLLFVTDYNFYWLGNANDMPTNSVDFNLAEIHLIVDERKLYNDVSEA